MSLYPFRKGFHEIELLNRMPQRNTRSTFLRCRIGMPTLPAWTAGLASQMLLPTSMLPSTVMIYTAGVKKFIISADVTEFSG